MFKVKIADKIIGIENRYKFAERVCADFLTEGEEEFVACCTDAEIEEERKVSQINTPEYCESACLCRNIAERMIDYDRFLFHSAVVVKDGKAYAFAAKSGVGKSTHAALWIKNIQGAYILNGDKPIFRADDNEITVYGTPWKGKENSGINSSAPLAAVCFLRRDSKNYVKKLNADEVVGELFTQICFPKDDLRKLKIVELLNKTVSLVPVYELHCNVSDEAAKIAYEGIKL